MTKLLILVFTSFSLFSFGQTNLPIGQGVIKIDYTKLPTLRFFADTSQTNPAKTIVISKDKDGEFIIKNSKQVGTWFMPEQISLEYDIFIIRVDTTIGKWYKVVTNTENAATLWTKVEPVKKFVKWSTFLLKETTAIEKGFANLDIKIAPFDTAKTIKKIETKDCFEVLEIKGDWMRIKTNTKFDCNQSNKPIKSGWLKWRDKNRLTISFGLTC
jgi:hypothetical protein